jgi:3-oxoacyl-[acyl-carrier protein] reductase
MKRLGGREKKRKNAAPGVSSRQLPLASGRLSGRVVLVTGGGAGIGRAVALALGGAGASVMVNYLSKRAAAEKVAAEICSQFGEAAVVRSDVSSPRGAERAVQATVREFGRIDILVNNVGNFLHKSILNVRPEEWQEIVQNNLHSAFYCSRCAIPHMRRRKWGRIVNLGVAGCETVRAFPNTAAYNISKTGVLILAKSLAKEVAPFGITVNVVAPGLIDTGVVRRRTMKELERSLPMKRTGTPEEVADVVLFLVGEEASYVTGSCVTVSGAWLL